MLASIGYDSLLGDCLLGGCYLDEYVVDIRCLQGDDLSGEPLGFHLSPQQKVHAIPGFEPIFCTVLGKILTQPVLVIACNAGLYHSVATVELAVSRMIELDSHTIEVEVIHVDAGVCTVHQWERLKSILAP